MTGYFGTQSIATQTRIPTPKIGFLSKRFCLYGFCSKKARGNEGKIKARKEEDAKTDYFALKRGIRELY